MMDGGEKLQEVFVLPPSGDVTVAEKGHGHGVELAVEGGVVAEGCERAAGLLRYQLFVTCKGEDKGDVRLWVEAENERLEAGVRHALRKCGKDLPLAPCGGVWGIANGVVDACSLLHLA